MSEADEERRRIDSIESTCPVCGKEHGPYGPVRLGYHMAAAHPELFRPILDDEQKPPIIGCKLRCFCGEAKTGSEWIINHLVSEGARRHYIRHVLGVK